jgi:putative glycosyltransferase
MKLSIVATLYCSAPYISEFCRRTSDAARTIAGDDFEIVLVNDGSPDESLEIAVQIFQEDDRIKVIDLSRNFGHHKAMMVGLEHSVGEKVFLIDSDLEEEPEWLLEFSQVMKSSSADVVYGVQKSRKGGWFERWSGSAYYTIFNWLCSIEHPRNIVTARLMSRRYVDALLRFREREMVISCLWVITGFKQYPKQVTKRQSSASTYNFTKKFDHAINSIASFSEMPLKLMFYAGLAIFSGALTYAAALIFLRFAHAQVVDGWTSVMVSIWLLGGMIISFIGVIGIYLAKIFAETKQRPSAIIREVYGHTNSSY